MDIDEPFEPDPESNHQPRRRPVTIHRTGRRGKLRAFAGCPPSFSTRHTRILQETGGNPVANLNRLISTLQENGIPGPQLYRLDREFSKHLGQGGQGNVRGVDDAVASQYRRTAKEIQKDWLVERIAIKQHFERKVGPTHETCFNQEDLSSRFRAAECEVLALAPGLFHNHPNIVRLIGWGLCLDTIEDPASRCCGRLQLPLLVFERAKMNLAQFLEDAFVKTRNDPGRGLEMEEGHAVYGQQSQSNTRSGSGSPHETQSSIRPETYELIRLLCIDVGHGLQSLHENNFTHGDLKPENVLIFNTTGRLTAKLCDFGCAIGHDVDSVKSGSADGQDASESMEPKHSQLRATYFGTPGWTPSDDELKAVNGFDGLRRCDVYVYGLLAWSAFFLRGRPFARHPNPEDIEDHVLALDRNWPDTPSLAWIIPLTTKVLMNTLKKPEDRSLTPWELLYQSQRERRWQGQRKDTKKRSRFKLSIHESNSSSHHLTLEARMKYHERNWWSSYNKPKMPSAFWKTHDNANGRVSVFKPGSTVEIRSDDNCLSSSLFQTERRFQDLQNLIRDMNDIVRTLSFRAAGSEELYHLARFRRRVPMRWWQEVFENQHVNILEMALRESTIVDMHTLVWLCAGPIGRFEAMHLTTNPLTWKDIITPSVFNESERLDRFLLLIQSGAPVQACLSTQQYETGSSIFVQFIDSYRPDISNTVVTQLMNRIRRSRADGLISKSAFDNFFRLVERRRDYHLNHLLPDFIPVLATETSPLVYPREAPYGWRVIENVEGKNLPSTCYKDEFTNSVTLTRPLVSPLEMRELTVGLLHQGGNLSFHVDLLKCLRSASGTRSVAELAHELDRRFPYYDETWLAMEWETEPNVADVLKDRKDPWSLETFASRLDPSCGDGFEVKFMAGYGFVFFCLAGLVSVAVYLLILWDANQTLFTGLSM